MVNCFITPRVCEIEEENGEKVNTLILYRKLLIFIFVVQDFQTINFNIITYDWKVRWFMYWNINLNVKIKHSKEGMIKVKINNKQR